MKPALYAVLPDIYDETAGSDTFVIFDALQASLDTAQAGLVDFEDDQSIDTSDGDGLDWLGELYNTGRPPGLDDDKYRAVIAAIAGARRGTIYAIKAVFEAVTSLTATVEDKQTNAAIPPYEIWITPSSTESFGRGFYPQFITNKAYYPVESSIAGVVFDGEGVDGGLFNDHAWAVVDLWTRDLIERVKMAGTKIVYKDQ